MTLGHENLDVYRVSIEYVRMAYDICKKLSLLSRIYG